MAEFDLILRGGRLLDPGKGLDGYLDLGVKGGRIAAISPQIDAAADRVIDIRGKLVLPGLVDLHVHAYWGVCEFGVEPDTTFLPHGVTTVLDVGSAGSTTLPGFRRYVVENARTRILALLNICTIGMVNTVGELQGFEHVDPQRTAAAVEQNRDMVRGVKVRLSRNVAGERDEEAFAAARQAADLAEVPLMVHFGDSRTPLVAILSRMEPGDVLTHCFTGRRNNILDENGRVLPAVWEAQKRGVVFDLGHGMGSCSFVVARAAIEQGFLPTSISSDLHAFSQTYPVGDLLTTMTKCLTLGIPLDEVVKRTTSVPARWLGLAETAGALAVGNEADVAVVQVVEGETTLWDAAKNSLVAPHHLAPYLTLKAGHIYLA